MANSVKSEQIHRLEPWFHNLHLPGGVQTAPNHDLGDFPRYKWQQIEPHLPTDMTGLQVLDIGCNAGFYSFELAKRGAEVTALDVDTHYLEQARWAAKIYGLENRINFREAPVYQLAYEEKQYDIIWFTGVLYHLRYPLLALDIVRRCCQGQMVFQTMTMPGEEVFPASDNYGLDQREIFNQSGWPKMAFIEHRIADDPTNWWAPNHAAAEAMLRAAGFINVERIAYEIYLCEVNTTPSSLAAAELQSLLLQPT